MLHIAHSIFNIVVHVLLNTLVEGGLTPVVHDQIVNLVVQFIAKLLSNPFLLNFTRMVHHVCVAALVATTLIPVV